MNTNFLQVGKTHCLVCHKDWTPTEMCAHLTTSSAIISTTPCTEECGKFYKAKCEHWYRFLDFLGVKKDKATFYCQKCLEIKIIEI